MPCSPTERGGTRGERGGGSGDSGEGVRSGGERESGQRSGARREQRTAERRRCAVPRHQRIFFGTVNELRRGNELERAREECSSPLLSKFSGPPLSLSLSLSLHTLLDGFSSQTSVYELSASEEEGSCVSLVSNFQHRSQKSSTVISVSARSVILLCDTNLYL